MSVFLSNVWILICVSRIPTAIAYETTTVCQFLALDSPARPYAQFLTKYAETKDDIKDELAEAETVVTGLVRPAKKAKAKGKASIAAKKETS